MASEQSSEQFEVAFDFKGESEYNVTELCEWLDVENTGNITYWEALGQLGVSESSARLCFTLPSGMSYDRYVTVLSYGRKILNIDGNVDDTYWPAKKIILSMTFDSQHAGNKVFIYQIVKGPYIASGAASPCYILEEGERILISDNIYDLEEQLAERIS